MAHIPERFGKLSAHGPRSEARHRHCHPRPKAKISHSSWFGVGFRVLGFRVQGLGSGV